MIIFEITYILTPAEPPSSPPFRLLKGVYAWHQSIVNQRLCFAKIDDIDFNISLSRDISYSEVKPLCISFRVDIVLQEEVVFEFSYLHPESSTLNAHMRLPDSN